MKRILAVASTGLVVAMGLSSLTLVSVGGANAKNEAAVEKPMKSEYVVKSGDTLASIAMKLSGRENDWILIAQENGLANVGKSQPLEAGKRLKIPDKLHQS
jgi:nucleoid-associated protein YgaU